MYYTCFKGDKVSDRLINIYSDYRGSNNRGSSVTHFHLFSGVSPAEGGHSKQNHVEPQRSPARKVSDFTSGKLSTQVLPYCYSILIEYFLTCSL